MRKVCIASWLLFFGFSTFSFSGEPSPLPVPGLKYGIDFKLEGPESSYTAALLKLLQSWPPKDIQYGGVNPNPVRMAAIETLGNKYYIGLEQVMFVDAPMEKVGGVLDDMDHYKDLFPDYDDVHVSARDGNRLVVFWEQHIPVFFIKNVKYEVWYLIDDSRPDRKVYRYKLKDGRGHIRSNDGVIVLEKDGAARTRYTEYDFFDADWGPLKAFAPSRIWKDSVEGLYLSDMAIKLKAENPTWSYDKIREESKKWLDRFPIDDALKARKPFNLF
ncbi:SRPBCC family protein [Bdellovibrionota bacterium FG-1]